MLAAASARSGSRPIVDARGDQLARIGHRGVHRDPGTGLVRRGDQPRDGAGRVGGLGVGPGGRVGEVGDDLDPGRSPADLRQGRDDQAGLIDRRVEQVREIAAGRGQEPAGRLQRRHAGADPSCRVRPRGDPTSRTRVIPACAQAVRFALAARASSDTRPAGPEPTAGRGS